MLLYMKVIFFYDSQNRKKGSSLGKRKHDLENLHFSSVSNALDNKVVGQLLPPLRLSLHMPNMQQPVWSICWYGVGDQDMCIFPSSGQDGEENSQWDTKCTKTLTPNEVR